MRRSVATALVAAFLAVGGCVYAPYRRVPGEAPLARPPTQPVTVEDVIRLVKAGVGEEVILAKIRADGAASRPSADQVLSMRAEGVSDRVIEALISAKPPPPVEPAPPRVVYRTEPAPWWVYDPWWCGWPYGLYWSWRHHWHPRP